ncbi:MAG: IPT/TIG domain-containing protein [Acidimicrobiia bacterium]|nr:IPT/TIG domain-containing protein [Acidimicrobiia bacterium]
MRVDDFQPSVGWPGTLLTISGDGFGSELDDNVVVIGGVRALVVNASPETLTVLVGEGTATGLIEVTTGGATATASSPFEIAEWPDVGKSATPGAPAFYSGTQHASPKLRAQNQPVLVILAHGLGNPPPGRGHRPRRFAIDVPRHRRGGRVRLHPLRPRIHLCALVQQIIGREDDRHRGADRARAW